MKTYKATKRGLNESQARMYAKQGFDIMEEIESSEEHFGGGSSFNDPEKYVATGERRKDVDGDGRTARVLRPKKQNPGRLVGRGDDGE